MITMITLYSGVVAYLFTVDFPPIWMCYFGLVVSLGVEPVNQVFE